MKTTTYCYTHPTEKLANVINFDESNGAYSIFVSSCPLCRGRIEREAKKEVAMSLLEIGKYLKELAEE